MLILSNQTIGPAPESFRVQWAQLQAQFPTATPSSTFIVAIQMALADVQDASLSITYTIKRHNTQILVVGNSWFGGNTIRGVPVPCTFTVQVANGLPNDMDIVVTPSRAVNCSIDVSLV